MYNIVQYIAYIVFLKIAIYNLCFHKHVHLCVFILKIRLLTHVVYWHGLFAIKRLNLSLEVLGNISKISTNSTQ